MWLTRTRRVKPQVLDDGRALSLRRRGSPLHAGSNERRQTKEQRLPPDWQIPSTKYVDSAFLPFPFLYYLSGPREIWDTSRVCIHNIRGDVTSHRPLAHLECQGANLILNIEMRQCTATRTTLRELLDFYFWHALLYVLSPCGFSAGARGDRSINRSIVTDRASWSKE